MIDKKDILEIIFKGDDSNLSKDGADFTRDSFSLQMLASDYLYIGHDKEFGSLYVGLDTPNVNPASLTLEVYDGASWTETSYFQDETKGLTRAGFIFWDKTGMNEIEVDGHSKFFMRLSISADSSLMSIRGMNLILSDDSRLRTNFPPINQEGFYPDGEESHLLTHVSARDEIIMELRKRYQKRNPEITDIWSKINVWDLIDIFELREAATYLALARTFHNKSDSPEDHWYQKYLHWNSKYKAAFETGYLSVDTDDDGKDDQEEKQARKQSAELYR